MFSREKKRVTGVTKRAKHYNLRGIDDEQEELTL